jgi:hypothetical protein
MCYELKGNNTVKLLKTCPSENHPSLNISRFLKPLSNNSLQRKSHKTGHSLNWPFSLVPVLAGLEKFHCISLLRTITTLFEIFKKYCIKLLRRNPISFIQEKKCSQALPHPPYPIKTMHSNLVRITITQWISLAVSQYTHPQMAMKHCTVLGLLHVI